MTKKEALEKVKELIADFQRNREYHLSKEFLENHCEENFVKPFIKALGWDIESRNIAPYLREVITQDRVTGRKTKRAPDYGFRLPGSDTRLFYIEAKGAFVKLKTDKEAAFQARWYGRTGKTPISILFNFAELAVYDCTQKQTSSSGANFARLKYFTCEEYVDNFDFIYDTFSKEAIYNGNFQNFIKDKTQKKGNVPLDKDFVESLEKWRLKLAKNIAAHNFKLNNEELNHAVQLLLDRVIFLRFCEERDVEPFGQLQSVAKHAHIYKHLFDLFYTADKKYNSGLFHFQDGCITEKLKVDDKTLRDIIEDLYPPKSDYSFYLMPVEILGNAYEQFLGKVIRITAGHNIKIEEKPEVRKAGGVYYTPQYIVDYIVEHTIGKLIAGKSPKEIEKIKIVDPACGSGSFLLGAFKYLLNYHQNYYFKKSPSSKELNADGTLTTIEKRKILTNNIFGVDLDENAVEVSKLSLLLKCMEGETASTVKQQINLHHTRVLPDLDKNIVNGNSLIGFNFIESELELDKAERKEVEHNLRIFDWKAAFPSVFKQGGFDAVIGNPPYGASIENSTKNYYQKNYAVTEGNYETFSFFIERGTKLLCSTGLLGYIIPDTWFTTKSSYKLRKYILDNISINEVQMLNENVFKDAKVDVCTFILSKHNTKNFNVYIYDKDDGEVEIRNKTYSTKNSFTVKEIKENPEYSFSFKINKGSGKIISKINSFKNKVEDYCIVGSGCKPYEGGKGRPPQTTKTLKEKPFTSDKKVDKTFRRLYRGEDVARYSIGQNRIEWLSYGEWLAAPRNPELFNNPRLLFQAIRNPKLKIRLVGTYIDDLSVNNNSLTNIIAKPSSSLSLKFILGILNSRLLNWFFRISYVIVNIDPRYLKQIPIPVQNAADKKFKSTHDEIVKNVDALLKLNLEKQENKKDDKVEQRIIYHENNINELVYKLYELSSEEIQTIERENEGN